MVQIAQYRNVHFNFKDSEKNRNNIQKNRIQESLKSGISKVDSKMNKFI